MRRAPRRLEEERDAVAAMTMMAHARISIAVRPRRRAGGRTGGQRSAALAELRRLRSARDGTSGARCWRRPSATCACWPANGRTRPTCWRGGWRRSASMKASSRGASRRLMRDLQRVCSICDNKRACEHDLDRSPRCRLAASTARMRRTLAALAPQHARRCYATGLEGILIAGARWPRRAVVSRGEQIAADAGFPHEASVDPGERRKRLRLAALR